MNSNFTAIPDNDTSSWDKKLHMNLNLIMLRKNNSKFLIIEIYLSFWIQLPLGQVIDFPEATSIILWRARRALFCRLGSNMISGFKVSNAALIFSRLFSFM